MYTRTQRIYSQGQALAELILAIAIIAIVGTIVAELIATGSRLGGSTNDSLVRLRLAEEAIETLRAIAQGNNASTQGWNRIYRPPDGTGDPSASKGAAHPYHPAQSGGIWVLIPGEETITLTGKSYGRKVVIDNISRNATAAIEGTYNPVNDDPATQKVTITVTALSSPPVSLVVYMTRYLNQGSRQTDWSGAINAGPFDATSNVTTISSSQSIDTGNSHCGVAGPCIRLQPQ